MELTIERKALVEELAACKLCAEAMGTIPVLAHVRLEAGEGKLKLASTNLEVGLRSEAAAQVKAAGACCVPLGRLLEYVKLLDGDEVKLQIEGAAAWLSVSSGRSRARIPGMGAERFPELPAAPEGFAPLPAGLAAALRVALTAVEAKEGRYTLAGVLLAHSGRELRVVSTDGHRLAALAMPQDGAPYQALLPLSALRLLLELGEAVEFAKSEEMLFFRAGARLASARRLTGAFPNYEAVLPKGDRREWSATLDARAWADALGRVATAAPGDSHLVRLGYGQSGKLKLSADTGESSADEEVDAEVSDTRKEKLAGVVGFNARYLLEYLAAQKAERVELRIADEAAPAELRAQDGASRYVVMPMRLPEAKPAAA